MHPADGVADIVNDVAGGSISLVTGTSSNSGSIYLLTKAGVNRLVFTGDGNLGVGTNSPSQKLDVLGYVRGSTGLCINNDCRTSWPSSSGGGGWTDGGTNVYLTTSSDSVGVGTSSPSQKLDVIGYVRGSTGLCINNACRTSWPTGTVTGSGTNTYLAMFTGSNSIGNSPIYKDGSNNVIVQL